MSEVITDPVCSDCGGTVYYDETTGYYYHDVNPRQLATIARNVRPRNEVQLP